MRRILEISKAINIRFTTRYHPQTQGIVDHLNVIVPQTLNFLIMERGKEKDLQRLLNILEITGKRSLHSCTGYTPCNDGVYSVTLVGFVSANKWFGVEVVQSFINKSEISGLMPKMPAATCS